MLPLKSFVFLFLLTFHAWSQQGVVLDHTTRQPLSGVLVTRNGVETQNTDAQGRYSFTGTLGTSVLDAVQNLGLHFSSGTGRFEWATPGTALEVQVYDLKGYLKRAGVALSPGVYLLKVAGLSGVHRFVHRGVDQFLSVPVQASNSGLAKTTALGDELVFQKEGYLPERKVITIDEVIYTTLKADRSGIVFDQNQIREYHLTMSTADETELDLYGNREEYLPATLRYSGGGIDTSFGTVGLRHKGAWSLHHCWDDNGGVRDFTDYSCKKLSYKIKFTEYNPDTRFYSLKKINLHAMAGEHTKLKDRLAYSIYNDFGIIAPRTMHAKVYVNGVYKGLFIAVEQIDGRFTARNWPLGGDGNLYKEAWPSIYQTEGGFLSHLKTNNDPEDNPDVSDFLAFAQAVDQATDANFREVLAPWVDLEQTLRYMAIDRAFKHWDGVIGFYSQATPHNFYFYHDDGPQNIFHLIPWDLDNVLWEQDPYMDPPASYGVSPIPDWNVLPSSCQSRPVWSANSTTGLVPPACDKFMRLMAKNMWPEFQQIGQELLNTAFSAASVNAKLNAWQTQIAPEIPRDPIIPTSYYRWSDAVADLRNIITQARPEFEAHLAEGWSEEAPEVLPEGMDDPIAESALIPEQINNFEFIGGSSGGVPLENYTMASPSTLTSVAINTQDPISGSADVLFTFDFWQTAGAYSEWVGLGLNTPESVSYDISGYSELWVYLKADKARNVRLRLNSPAYENEFGGAWTEFGQDLNVTTQAVLFKLPLSAFAYPNWAKAAWTGTTGWSGSDGAALALVLSQFNGLIFAPAASFNGAGEMLTQSEAGFIQIDNIMFR
jgi:hypothetical protein